MDEADAMILTDGATELAEIVMALLVALGAVMHDALEVITTLTTSPLFKLLEVRLGELVPTFTPFTCH